MSYSQPIFTTNTVPVAGATATTQTIRGPKGKSGRVVDVRLTASTAFVGTTTPCTVLVKTPAAAATQINYATATFGSAATPLTTLTAANASDGGQAPSDTVQGILLVHELPADGDVRVQVVAATGGAPAGVGQAEVTIAWY